MELLRIGVRNVRRNTRRTVLNVIALALGTAIMIVSVAWVRGYFTSLFDGIIRIDTGHAQVLHGSYRDEQRRLPLDLTVRDYNAVRDTVRDVPSVTAIAARLDFGAQISSEADPARSIRLLGRGVEPELEERITVVADHIVRGSALSEARRGVLLSERIASRLRVEPGDAVIIRAIDRSGAWQERSAELVGVFTLGYPAIDETSFLISLPIAQELTGISNAVTRLVIALDSGPAVASNVAAVNAALGDWPELRAYEWRRFVEVIVQAVEADAAGFAVIIVVLYLLIIVGILNSMSMSVHERRREIGTLRAIGMKRAPLRRLILVEGAAVALIGAAAGAVLAGLSSIYFAGVGFDLSILEGTGLPLPFGERFVADFRVHDYLIATAIAVVTACVGTILPATRSARLPITDALGAHVE
ncbi:MAG: ABC transporter permease [Spirochaetaceae bacterium]|nr:MAG: ABC transporter permease [Spirochaetaceae bacterium]